MAGRVRRRVAGMALMALAQPLAATAQGSSPSLAGIYSCVDAQGRRLTSDRPIPECVNREQRVLNRDGSVQRVLQPTLTAEERAERAKAEERLAEERREREKRAARRRELEADERREREKRAAEEAERAAALHARRQEEARRRGELAEKWMKEELKVRAR